MLHIKIVFQPHSPLIHREFACIGISLVNTFLVGTFICHEDLVGRLKFVPFNMPNWQMKVRAGHASRNNGHKARTLDRHVDGLLRLRLSRPCFSFSGCRCYPVIRIYSPSGFLRNAGRIRVAHRARGTSRHVL